VVGCAVALGAAVLLGRGAETTTGGPVPPIDGIPCEREALSTHHHAHLELRSGGVSLKVPANIGINTSMRCFYWLHTHDDSGVIHIEAPAPRSFTLGQLFDIWGQPLSTTRAAELGSAGGPALHVFVDGQPVSGDPRTIQLTPHQQIVIEAGPSTPPPTFTFPDGL